MKNILKKIKYELQFNNPQYYARIRDKIMKTFYNRVLKRKILSIQPLNLIKENATLTLAILANKKNFFESIAAIYSFCFWNKNVHIHYHEDGTLTNNEFKILEKVFPGIQIFKREEQNLKVKNYLTLRGLNYCVQLRDHFIFSLRTFDMILEKRTPYLIQIDSDVLFFKKPCEIFTIIEEEKLNGCYNCDVANSYTFDKETMTKYVSAPIADRFNAGLFLHNIDEKFWKFVDNVLEKEPQASSSWHLEQTLFAMYISKVGNYKELPVHYDVCRQERNLGHQITSEHYTHNTGYDFHKDFLYKIYPGLQKLN